MKLINILNEITKTGVYSWAESIRNKYNIDEFEVFDVPTGDLLLSKLAIDPQNQNHGTGSKIMNKLCKFADKNKRRIILTPNSFSKFYKTTSQDRLIQFYERFGFILNKGRDKIRNIDELMYRNPQ